MGELIKVTTDNSRVYIDRSQGLYMVSVSTTNHIRVVKVTDSYLEARIYVDENL